MGKLEVDKNRRLPKCVELRKDIKEDIRHDIILTFYNCTKRKFLIKMDLDRLNITASTIFFKLFHESF